VLFLLRLIDLYELLLFLAALSTWIAPTSTNPVVRFLRSATEPLLRRIRPLLPTMGGMDISPIVAILALEIISWVLVRLVG